MLGTLDAVLARLGVDRPTPDLEGLRSVYAAWCHGVPFDNVLKLVHLGDGTAGDLPGSTGEDFFASWLETGAGGTCWAGNGALDDLLASLGFETERVAATMLPGPDRPGPNHGSVAVSLEGRRWLVDASILSGVPLRLPAAGETSGSGPLPRIELRDRRPTVIWRTLTAPEGFPCRIDRIGIGVDEWDALHQATRAASLFNYAVNARTMRGGSTVGLALGQRFAFDERAVLSVEPRDGSGRDRFLIEELGVSGDLVRRVPPDRPVPAGPL